MDDAAKNVNISLEQEFFTYYQTAYLTVVNLVSEFCEGEISEHELATELKQFRDNGMVMESDMMTKYEYLKRHYQVGGVLRSWYSRLAR